MKPMLPPIRQNVFLAAGHSPFLELSTLQKGPIAPFSVTTPLLDAFCVLPGVELRAPPLFPYGRIYPLIAVCRISDAPSAALTPSKHTLHFAVTCVSRS